MSRRLKRTLDDDDESPLNKSAHVSDPDTQMHDSNELQPPALASLRGNEENPESRQSDAKMAEPLPRRLIKLSSVKMNQKEKMFSGENPLAEEPKSARNMRREEEQSPRLKKKQRSFQQLVKSPSKSSFNGRGGLQGSGRGLLQPINILKMVKKIQQRYERGDRIVADLINVIINEVCPRLPIEIPVPHYYNNQGSLAANASHGDQPAFQSHYQPTVTRYHANEKIQYPTKKQFQERYLDRFRAAKIEGFEGVALLNLKINKKRKQNGDKLINLAKECAGDLKDREDDQYELFQEIVKLFNNRLNILPQLQAAQTVTQGSQQASVAKANYNPMSSEAQCSQNHLQNIKNVKFVVPDDLHVVEPINIQEQLPLLIRPKQQLDDAAGSTANTQFQRMSEVYWKQLKTKVDNQLNVYWDELCSQKENEKTGDADDAVRQTKVERGQTASEPETKQITQIEGIAEALDATEANFFGMEKASHDEVIRKAIQDVFAIAKNVENEKDIDAQTLQMIIWWTQKCNRDLIELKHKGAGDKSITESPKLGVQDQVIGPLGDKIASSNVTPPVSKDQLFSNSLAEGRFRSNQKTIELFQTFEAIQANPYQLLECLELIKHSKQEKRRRAKLDKIKRENILTEIERELETQQDRDAQRSIDGHRDRQRDYESGRTSGPASFSHHREPVRERDYQQLQLSQQHSSSTHVEARDRDYRGRERESRYKTHDAVERGNEQLHKRVRQTYKERERYMQIADRALSDHWFKKELARRARQSTIDRMRHENQTRDRHRDMHHNSKDYPH